YRSPARRLEGRFLAAEDDARRSLALLAVSPPARAGPLAALALALLERGAAREALEAPGEPERILPQYGGVEELEPPILPPHPRPLEAGGDQARALEAASDAGRRVLARAEGISDPALRESFLRELPENALLLELAQRSPRDPARATASR